MPRRSRSVKIDVEVSHTEEREINVEVSHTVGRGASEKKS